MKAFVVVAILSFAALSAAEPPVSRNYIPPSTNYLPPSTSYEASSSNQFSGNRDGNGYNYQAAPSSSYGAPSTSYGTPSSSYGPPSSTYGAPGLGGGNGNTGYEDNNSEPAKYSFEYKVEDFQSGNDFGHMETRDGDRTVGRYYVLLPDGRKQIVNYEADQNGYRPTITYEQTNTGNGGSGGYPSSNGGNGGYPSSSGNNGGFNGY